MCRAPTISRLACSKLKRTYASAFTELIAPTAKTITSTAFRDTLTLGEDLRLLRVELALGQNP